MRSIFPTVVFATTLLLTGQSAARAQAQPAQVQPAQTAVLKFEPMAQHGGPVLSLRVNNSVQARFVLDTGTNGSAISREFADKLKLPLINAPGGFKGVKIKNLQLGPWDMGGGYLVLEGPIQDFLREKNVDGIIGLNVLKDLAVVLNFEKQECSLTFPGNLTKEAVAAAGFADALPTDLIIAGKESYYAPVNVVGNSAWLLIDTGYWRTSPPKSFAGLFTDKPLLEQDTLAFKGIKKEPVYLVSRVAVGYARGRKQTVILTKSRDESGECSLGMDFLAQFNVLIDFPAKKLYLHRLDKPNPSLESNHQDYIEGMVIGVKNGVWKVLTMDSLSRFSRAGLRAGDVIEAINDTDMAGLLTDQVAAEIKRLPAPAFHTSRMVDGKAQKKLVLVSP